MKMGKKNKKSRTRRKKETDEGLSTTMKNVKNEGDANNSVDPATNDDNYPYLLRNGLNNANEEIRMMSTETKNAKDNQCEIPDNGRATEQAHHVDTKEKEKREINDNGDINGVRDSNNNNNDNNCDEKELKRKEIYILEHNIEKKKAQSVL